MHAQDGKGDLDPTVRGVALAVVGLLLAATASPVEEVRKAWTPTVPEGFPVDFDWIRLPSDEWLKREIISS